MVASLRTYLVIGHIREKRVKQKIQRQPSARRANGALLCLMLLAVTLLASCQTGEAEIPTQAVRMTETATAIVALQATASFTPLEVPSPTGTPVTPSATPTPSYTPTSTITPVPTNTRRPRPTATFTPSLASLMIATNPPGEFDGGTGATWTPPPFPQPLIQDHYVFKRPFDLQYGTYWARSYSYGSTDNGTRPIHHGLDFPNVMGVPILAAAPGVVYYAGDDITSALYGPQPNYYGNVIVIEHPFLDADGEKVYSLYGHLSRIEVKTGQKVKVGDEIGLVGSEGVALGAHLHFEVRVGRPTDYGATRNPELWIIPYPGAGVLAGRVMDLSGNLVLGVQVQIQSPSVSLAAYSYADDSVNPDPYFGENYVIPDLQEGWYNVFIRPPDGALKFKQLVYIWPGRTNWLDIHIVP